ncbi:MAG: hypothetical protein HGA19_09825, partial [Oscillochloris sp.]|nr:hypothetical protein [Oscillochloris sp.]
MGTWIMNLRHPTFAILNSLLLILSFSLAGCASQPVSVPTAQPAVVVAGPIVNFGNGGTLIMALGARDPNTLDPALAGDAGSAFIIRQLFSGLTRLDNTLEVQPDLAESWDISSDGLTYTFTLRATACFADGRAITSDDVLYSLERAADPSLGSSLPAATYLSDIVGVREKLAGQAKTISGISAPDAHTVVIT